jgi:hypothetical protein
VCGHRIWIIGGVSGEGVESKTIYSWGAEEAAWREEGEAPEVFVFHGMAAADGCLYVAGGIGTSAHAWRFDTEQRTWERIPDIPTPRNRHRACFHERRLYVIGGMSLGKGGHLENQGANEAYDVDTGTWHALAPMPTPRHGHSAVVCGDTIVCTGGGHGEHGRAEVYDIATDTWTQRAPCPSLREHGKERGFNLLFHEAVDWDGKVYHFGARDRDPIPVLEYDPSADAWRIAQLHGPLIHRAASVKWGAFAVIPGGESSATGGPHVLKKVFVLDLPGLTRRE